MNITTSAIVDAATKGSVVAAAAIATKEDAQVSLPDAVEAATQAVITVDTKFEPEAADSDSPSVVESVANTTISTVTALVQEAAADDLGRRERSAGGAVRGGAGAVRSGGMRGGGGGVRWCAAVRGGARQQRQRGARAL